MVRKSKSCLSRIEPLHLVPDSTRQLGRGRADHFPKPWIRLERATSVATDVTSTLDLLLAFALLLVARFATVRPLAGLAFALTRTSLLPLVVFFAFAFATVTSMSDVDSAHSQIVESPSIRF